MEDKLKESQIMPSKALTVNSEKYVVQKFNREFGAAI